ncbi:MAG: DUF4215 domain-containing protein [Nannocystaceae bacterium]
MPQFRLLLGLALLLSACTEGPPGDDGDHNLSTTTTSDSTSTSTTMGVSTVTGAVTTDVSTTTASSGTDSDSVSSSTTTTTSSTTDVTTTGHEPVCGDGVVEGDEFCDDGNDVDVDDCKNDCSAHECGDGTLYKGIEECDDGNLDSTDECTEKCEDAECGDGYVHAGYEACDDGDEDNTNACTELCEEAICGDGFVHKGFEVCDDGLNNNAYGGCAPDCEQFGPHCGDGVQQANQGERCDITDPYLAVGCTDVCTYEFSMVKQFYCHGTCSWAGPDGCDQADADIFCKLLKGDPAAKATSFNFGAPLPNLGGFGCGNPNKFVNDGMGNDVRKNLGQLPEYGVYQPVFYVEKNMSLSHAGTTITSVTCSGG